MKHSKIPRDEWRLAALTSAGFLAAAFVAANERESASAAMWYMGIAIFYVLLLFWLKGNQGIDDKWRKGAFMGAAMAGVFAMLHMWQPSIFNLGYPQAISDISTLMLTVIAAGILEEGLFRQLIYKWILRVKWGFMTSAVISSALFMAFHYYVYSLGAAPGAASAAFVGAFSFGMIAAWLTEETGNCFAAAVLHMITNAFLLMSPYFIFGM
jgi:membrane protease YdiL (CAAX protease family)